MGAVLLNEHHETMPGLNLGDTVPDFSADTSMGPIKFHEWIGDSWAVLFSHPADYTPVCTTELGTVAKMQAEFDKRGCKTIALSCNDSRRTRGGSRTSRPRRASPSSRTPSSRTRSATWLSSGPWSIPTRRTLPASP